MRLKVENQIIKLVEPLFFVSGSVGIYEIEFEFSDDWAGFGKTAVFQSAYGESWEQVLADDKCIVPHEVLIAKNPKLHELLPIRIGVYGVADEMVKPTAWTCPLQLHIGATEGTPHVDPTPTQWEQILARLGKIDADVVILRERVDEYSIAIDVVGTKADLDAYDTSGLHPNDKVKVLADETHSGKTTYWKWAGTAWEYVGLIDTGYTKMEADAKFETQEHAEETYKTIEDADAEFEKADNKTTTISSASTNEQYPSAMAVFKGLKAKSNPNLLLNPWFTVNQRELSGQIPYGEARVITDGWWIQWNQEGRARYYYTPSTHNVRVIKEANYTEGAPGIWQNFEYAELRGKYTLSARIDGQFYSRTFEITGSEEIGFISNYYIEDRISLRYSRLDVGNWEIGIFAKYDNPAEITLNVDRAKLEIGGVSTLEADTMPDYATELLKCQRRLQVFKATGGIPFNGHITASGAERRLMLPLSCPMRTTPAVTLENATFGIRGNGGYDNAFPLAGGTPTESLIYYTDGHAVGLVVRGAACTTIPNNSVISGVITSGKVILSAEL